MGAARPACEAASSASGEAAGAATGAVLIILATLFAARAAFTDPTAFLRGTVAVGTRLGHDGGGGGDDDDDREGSVTGAVFCASLIILATLFAVRAACTVPTAFLRGTVVVGIIPVRAGLGLGDGSGGGGGADAEGDGARARANAGAHAGAAAGAKAAAPETAQRPKIATYFIKSTFARS